MNSDQICRDCGAHITAHYVRCVICGMSGNWFEYFEGGYCHNPKKKKKKK